MKKEERYLFPADYMADPSVHVFNGRLYIYPSHDRESGIPENDNGDHFDMNDYHVLSTDDVMHGEIVDHGVALKVADIPWAGRQLWDCDIACKDGKYYLYFPLKDRNDIFRMGVAIGDKPKVRLFLSPIRFVEATVLMRQFSAMMTEAITCILAESGEDSCSVTVITKPLKVRVFQPIMNRLYPVVW